MTAVNLTRLRHQVQEMLAFFSTPDEFRQKLGGLFSLYANYALRFGEIAPFRPLIPMYHLPHPVLRQLYLDLKTAVENDPPGALVVADALWLDDHYEVKHTAIFIIGAIPLESPQPVLERIRSWLTPDLDQVLKLELLSIGTRTLQNHYPGNWEALILSLLSNSAPETIALGIQALAEGAKRPNFDNLPAVFRLVSPYLRAPHSAYTRDLEDLIETLAALSPKETGFFLKQTLAVSTSPDTPRLIKSCLPSFPAEVQADLRSALNA
jgi:hypothetical protein